MRTSKKIVSLILAVMMVVSMMSVMAVSVSAVTYVAQVGETQYETVGEASQAANNGELMVTFLANPTYELSVGEYIRYNNSNKTQRNRAAKLTAPAGYVVSTVYAPGSTTDYAKTVEPATFENTNTSDVVTYSKALEITNTTKKVKLLNDATDIPITVSNVADFEFDLNGFTYTDTANSTTQAIVNSGVYLKAGTTSAHKSFTLSDSSEGKTGKFITTAPVAAIWVDSSYTDVIIDGAEVVATGDTYGVGFNANVTGSSLTLVNGGKITAEQCAVYTNGGSQGNTLNIESGTITSTNGVAVYSAGNNELNISGGTITGETAVYVKSGTTTITGGTLVATGSEADYTYDGNAANPTGDALVVDSCNYPGGAPVVSVTGGTFTSDNAEAVASYTDIGDGASVPEQVTEFITGGSFENGNGETIDEEYFSSAVDTQTDSNGVVSVVAVAQTWEYVGYDKVFTNHGTFENALAARGENSIYLLTDITYTPTEPVTFMIKNNGHTFTVAEPADPNLLVEKTHNPSADWFPQFVTSDDTYTITYAVAKVGEVGYPSFESALNAATDGSTITLLQDTEVLDFTVDGKKLTFDLNGKELTVTGHIDRSKCINGAEVDFVSNDGEGKLTFTGDWGALFIEGEDTKVTIGENVTVSGRASDTAVGVFAGELIVDGGTVTNSNGSAIATNGDFSHDFTITIEEGSTISSTGSADDSAAIYAAGDGNIIINGGTIESTDNDAIAVNSSAAPEVSISGGTFSDDSAYEFVANDAFVIKDAEGNTVVSDTVPAAATAIEADDQLGVSAQNITNHAILGYQTSTTTEENQDCVRIITAVNEGFLKGDNIADYGYVVAKYNGSLSNAELSTPMANILKYNNDNFKTISCYGTSNTVASEAAYGDFNADSTYKFVTLAIGDMNYGDKVIARFYIKTKDGKVYYSQYQTYSGILATYLD